MRSVSPTSRRQARRLAPFAAAALLPYALLMAAPAHWGNGHLLASAALTLAIGVATVLAPWVRLAPWMHVVPALAYIGALALLREAGEGTSDGTAVLLLLPVFWLALYGTREQLSVVLVATLAFYALPGLLAGAADHSLSGVGPGILFTAVSGIIGVTVQGLVGRIREQAREREEHLAHLADLAYTDSLTGLPNRRAWTAALQSALVVAEQTGEALTVAMLDLDNFKAFNDSRGHGDGDALLAGKAVVWRERLRPTDVVARLGGDEFGILLPGCGASEAPVVLERMLEPASAPDVLTCSIGFAEWDRRRSGSALLREADRALYEAKRRGRAAVAAAA